MKFLTIILLLLSSLKSLASTDLTISAAISLKPVLEKVINEFKKKEPKINLITNYGASGQLKAQIIAGAPVDIFIPAATKELDELIGKNIVFKESKLVIARNTLIVIQKRKNNFISNNLSDLKQDQIKKIAIGNPDYVPAGMYAKEAMLYFKIWEDLVAKIVYAENARQVVDYVQRGEVEIGFCYLTDISNAINLKSFVVDSKSHSDIIYPLGIISKSQKRSEANSFISFLTTKQMQTIFKTHGFILP